MSVSAFAVLFTKLLQDDLRIGGHAEGYFESAAAIVMLVLLGKVLELRARRRASSAIRELFSLAPPTAQMVRDENEIEVALDAVQSGDVLRVRPGEKIPADGKLADGKRHAEESTITGEPVPVQNTSG